MSVLRTTAGIAGRAIALSALLVSVLVLVAGIAVPRAAGAMPYAVLTGSMSPRLPPGSLVIVRPTDPDAITVGAVITYQLRSGQPEVVTHRVIGGGVSTTTGEKIYRTKGDANPVADPGWIQPAQIRGEVWYALPWVGHLSQWITGKERITLITLVATGLAAYAAWMLVSALRDHFTSRNAPPRPPRTEGST